MIDHRIRVLPGGIRHVLRENRHEQTVSSVGWVDKPRAFGKVGSMLVFEHEISPRSNSPAVSQFIVDSEEIVPGGHFIEFEAILRGRLMESIDSALSPQMVGRASGQQ